jgi:hypothetical protein
MDESAKHNQGIKKARAVPGLWKGSFVQRVDDAPYEKYNGSGLPQQHRRPSIDGLAALGLPMPIAFIRARLR